MRITLKRPDKTSRFKVIADQEKIMKLLIIGSICFSGGFGLLSEILTE